MRGGKKFGDRCTEAQKHRNAEKSEAFNTEEVRSEELKVDS
jgi:hypothetical protein